MRDRLTQFFTTHYAWTPNWSRIKLCRDGWALRVGSILCPDNIATTIALPGRYEVHYREPLHEATLCHEIAHVWQMERMGVGRYVMEYAWEMRRGYRDNRFEVEARNVANQYGGSNK